MDNPSHTATEPDPHGWRQEGQDVIRAIAAGSIVGIPLVYTMEMWWHGITASEGHLLAVLGLSLLVTFCFSLFSGFRESFSIGEAVSEAISAVGLGILYSLAVLCLIREITFEMHLTDILGRVIFQTLPVSLGIVFANSQVRGKTHDGEKEEQDQNRPAEDPNREQLKQDLNNFAATLGGATVFALAIAPTQEVMAISARTPVWQHLVLMVVSFELGYLILFAAGFQKRRVYVPSLAQNPWTETMVAYALSLLVAFVLLYFVGVSEAMSSISVAIKTTIVLGLPAVVGGAAGRLIV